VLFGQYLCACTDSSDFSERESSREMERGSLLVVSQGKKYIFPAAGINVWVVRWVGGRLVCMCMRMCANVYVPKCVCVYVCIYNKRVLQKIESLVPINCSLRYL